MMHKTSATLFSFSVPTALLLAALLPAVAADVSTAQQCYDQGVRNWGRVRQYPTDSETTLLGMERCNLTEVNPSEDFEGLPHVFNIFFSWNNIAHINTTAFQNLPRLFCLHFGGNKLEELPVFEEHSCTVLTEFYVNDNLLTGIYNPRTFQACPDLKTLWFFRNNIEYIHADAFSTLTKLRELDLYDNKLTFIPDGLFAKTVKLQKLNLKRNKLTHLPSDIVTRLSNSALLSTSFYFHDNPLHCSCLLELLAELKRTYISYYRTDIIEDSHENTTVDYADEPVDMGPYDGSLPLCVFVGRYPCHRHTPTGLIN